MKEISFIYPDFLQTDDSTRYSKIFIKNTISAPEP